MSYTDGNRPAPMGAITIYRATEAVGGVIQHLRGALTRGERGLRTFTPAQLEDLGLTVADMPAAGRPGILARMVESLRERNARRRTVAALDRLTDAQLQDIGLTRVDIENLRLGIPLV